MTELLVKCFIKNKDDYSDPSVRTAYGILASVVGIICNVMLFAVKLGIGLFINSISVMADAFNNLSDAASSVISFFGVKLASQPADREHPFGHGRMEYISALVVAFLIVQVGFSCFQSACSKLLNPEEVTFSALSVGILCLSMGVKLWLSLFNRKLGRRIDSSVMKAAAADARGDVLITGATVLSIVIGKITRIQTDGFMGIIVSVVVLIAGFHIAKDTLEPLLGAAASREDYERITKKVQSYPGIVGSHDLIIHNYGPSRTMATIHAEVPNDIELEKAHETIDKIERDVLREMGIFLVIHMDPVEVNDQKVVEKKMAVNELVKKIEPKASIHDFRIVNGEQQINLIFDLVVPRSYGKEKENELLLQVIEAVRKMDSRYQCVITLETSYIEEEE